MKRLDFYRGKRVLVTGHTGFKGSWLSRWLQTLGARVVGVALAPAGGGRSLFEAACIGNDMISVIQDIRDLGGVLDVMAEHDPEIIFHMAAQALVRPSYDDPVGTYHTNVMGTVNVLEAARQLPSLKSIVVVTSDKCYENREWIWSYRENDPMGGHDPYSSSKGCAELVTGAYRRSFFSSPGTAAIATARAGNVIGGGDWGADRIVPDIMRAAFEGTTATIRNPAAIRPWQHVLDPLYGYLALGRACAELGHSFSEGWNFGPSDEDAVSVGELVRRIAGEWPDIRFEEAAGNAGEPHEAHHLKLDCTKARQRLDWRPMLNIDEAIEMTVRWYRGYYADRAAAAGLMSAQVEEFSRLIETAT